MASAAPDSIAAVRQAFDAIADETDVTSYRNPIGNTIRSATVRELTRTFPEGSTLLDIGCSTGKIAIELARGGRRIFGLDLSPRTVEKARENISNAGLQDRVAVVCGRASNVAEIARASPWAEFDGGYAYNVLTYEDPLGPFVGALARVLDPGAMFLCTFPNRLHLARLAIYGAQLRFGRIVTAGRASAVVNVGGEPLGVRLYRPREVNEAFRGPFRLRGMVGLGAFLPPSELHEAYGRLGGMRAVLAALDDRFSASFPWSHLGNGTLFKFERQG